MFFVALIAAAVIGSFIWKRATGPDDSQLVLELSRSGSGVASDQALDALLAGSADIDVLRAAKVALCVNGWYWATDVALDLDVVVSTSGRYTRVAEVAASGAYSNDLIAAVEQELLGVEANPSLQLLTAKTRKSFGDDALDAYLSATANEPSPSAKQRFVVYATNSTMTRQLIFFVDTDRLDRTAISRFVSEPGTRGQYQVQVAGGEPVDVSRDDCTTLD